MSNYSIKDLETLSGIKAHTLRIWEQRYNIIQPKRTETNIRFYDDDDLKRLLNISLLNQHGFKISKIAAMSVADMNAKVLAVTQETLQFPDQVQSLVLCMMDLDEDRFEKIISRCILQSGLEKTMIHVVYPLLNKVGLLWQIGTINPYQEHFISNLIRQKLIVAIDAQHLPTHKGKKFLLFLPENELHEIGLLFASYLLKARGHKVFYFGQVLPFHEFKEACQLCQPDFTFTVMTSQSEMEGKNLLENIVHQFPTINHIATGYLAPFITTKAPNLYVAGSVEDFISYIESRI